MENEMKQQKTKTVMGEMLDTINNDILQQKRKVRTEQNTLYNKQFNAIAQMCEEMQEKYLYVNFRKTGEFTDEQYIEDIINKHLFTDNDMLGQPHYKITTLEYYRNDTISITLKNVDANVDAEEFEFVFIELNQCDTDDTDIKWIDTLYKLMQDFVKHYQPTKKWINRI